MERKNYIYENQKNNQIESNLKLNRLKNRQHSIDIIISNYNINKRKTSFYNFLYNKNGHMPSIRKISSKEKGSTCYIRASDLPSINLNQLKNPNKKQLKTINNNTYDIQLEYTNEKEKIISQLFSEKSECDKKNLELIELRNIYKRLKENNMTYKLIIEKILDIEDETEEDDNNNNDLYKEVKKINKKKKHIGINLINFLKKQILEYDKTIEEKNKILEETKKEERITNFININKLLNAKNRELEFLVFGSQELQYFQCGMDNRVDFLNISIKKFKENIINLNDKLKLNEKLVKDNEDMIQKIIKEKEAIKNKIEKLEKEKRRVEEEKIKKKEILIKSINEYENMYEIEKDKEKIENNIERLVKQENIIKKTIEKNNTKIIISKKHNNSLENDLSIIEKQDENIRQYIKNKQDIKTYEKEIKLMKEEIEKNKKIELELIIKNEEEKERIQREIEEFEKARINLINKINELNRELTEKTKLNTKKEEELTKTNKEYDDISKLK